MKNENLIGFAAEKLIKGTYLIDFINRDLYPQTKAGIANFIKEHEVSMYHCGTFGKLGFFDFTRDGFKIWGEDVEVVLKYKNIVNAAYMILSEPKQISIFD